MVQNRITDSKRIAQFLASELTGLETGILTELSMTDVDEDAEPSSEGTEAYRIERDGNPVARVVLYPERVVLQRSDERDWEAPEDADKVTLADATLHVEQVAGVKQALDTLRETLN